MPACPLAVLLLAAAPQSQPLERQAYRAYQGREWAEAARLYDQFHEAGSGSAASYDNLGVALTNLGRWRQAEAALRRAVQLDTQHRWAYNHLGFVLREIGRAEEAVQMFRRQIEISAKDPYAHRNLASTLAALGRLEEAGRAAATAEEYTYERGAVFIDIACQLNSRRQPDQALRYLDRARAAGVDAALLAQESAHYHLTRGETRQAEEQYRKLLDLRPGDPLAALRLGALYWESGKPDQAAAAFARVLAIDDQEQATIRLSASATKTLPLAELLANPPVLGDVPLDLGRAARLAHLHMLHSQDPASPALRSACRQFLASESVAPAYCR